MKIKGRKSLLLKLDYMKACDRLDHFFIRDFLWWMGFNKKIIRLVMGLVGNGTSKAHFNGLFTKEIPFVGGSVRGAHWLLCCLHWLPKLLCLC